MSKLGISGLNEQEITHTPISFDKLKIDVYPIIFNNIPAYQFLGKETIATVSKPWNNCLEANRFFKSYSKILAACVKDPEGALTILNDDSIRQHLTFDQFLEISSCNPGSAQDLLDKQELCDKLPSFGQYLSAIAQQPLDTKKRLDKLDGHDLAKLGQHLPEIAQQILNKKELCDKLCGQDLAILGQHHPEIAQHILNKKELCDMLSGPRLAILGQHHPAIAQYILNIQELRNKLTKRGLAGLEKKSRFVGDVCEHVEASKQRNSETKTQRP
jgi:hypothetical protein